MTKPDADWPRLCVCLSDAGFSRAVLGELLARKLDPSLVMLPEFPPAAISANIAVVEPPTRKILQLIDKQRLVYAAGFDDAELARQLRDAGVDYLLVACWPHLLGPQARAAAGRASLNLHPSSLPRYRGADPIADQLDANDEILGVSLHLLDARFDHGDIVGQDEFQLAPTQRHRAAIESEAARRGVDLLVEAMLQGPARWRPRPQDQEALDTA